MPALHWPVVSTRKPSMSILAWSKKAAGCSAHPPTRTSWTRYGSFLEAAAEVAGGRRVGEALGTQGVEEDFVLAAEFEVLEAGAVAQGVVGKGQDVGGFVVGEVELEQVELPVAGVDEADLARQGMEGAA